MKALKVFTLVFLVAVMTTSLVAAQGGGVWDSSFTVVNLGTSDATVSVTFYAEDGTAYTPPTLGTSTGAVNNPFTLAPGSSVEILLFLTTGLPDGRYSVVISADQPIAAIANLTNTVYSPPQSPSFSGSYSGFEDVGQTAVYMPAIVEDYYNWNSHVSMQNLTGGDLAITIEFFTEGTNTVCHTEGPTTVKAYSSWHLDVSTLDLANTSCNVNPAVDGYNGSAKVSAAGPIAVVDNQTADIYGMTATYRGFTPDQATNKYFVPALYYLYYNWFSSINIQNVGTVATTVTVDYSDSAADATCDLDPGESCLLINLLETGHDPKFSAVVTADNPAAQLVVVAQAGTTVESGLNQAFAYEPFSAGGTTFGLPLTMDMYYGWFTSFTVQNVGTANVNIQYTYAPDPSVGFAGATCNAGPIAPGANLEIVQIADPCVDLPEGYHGGVVVTGTGPIIVIVSQNNVEQMTARPGDWSMSYRGVSQQ
ncbi:MAG: hypothetical protein QXU79_03420 [Candidatus Micrarchaeaceae archaeon]